MALFKLRKKVDEPVAAAAPAESMEAVRRRARHRLIGAVVLVLLGVVGFPLLFDTQPRPVPVDIPIEIPDRNKVAPLPPLSQAPSAQGKVVQAPIVAPITASPEAAGPAEAKPEAQAKAEPAPPAAAPPATAAPAESKPAPDKLARTEAVPAPKAEPKPEAKADAPAHDGAKARALLEGRTVSAAAEAGRRYVVQVGAFAEKSSARQAQQKLERAGLKNYTNITETRNGPRIRVRAGPFGSRAEADSAAEKIKGLDLPAAILSL